MRIITAVLLFILSTTLNAIETIDENMTETKFKNVQELIKKAEYDKAIPILKAMVAAEKSAEAFNYLGYSYRQIGNMDRAIKHYQSSLQLDPNQKDANQKLGEIFLINGDLSKAHDQLLVLQKLCPSECIEYQSLKDRINYFKKTIYRMDEKISD